jgi:hypothetical protein
MGGLPPSLTPGTLKTDDAPPPPYTEIHEDSVHNPFGEDISHTSRLPTCSQSRAFRASFRERVQENVAEVIQR